MKTPHLKVITPTVNKLPAMLGTPILSLGALWLFVATANLVLAVDAVWLQNPGSGEWNAGTNWSTSPFAPTKAGDTATFNTSTQTLLTLSANATVESITFQSGASAFTLDTSGKLITVEGAGIVNRSGKTQTITNDVGAATLANAVRTAFKVAATAGGATIINQGGQTLFGATTEFDDASSAGSATLINNSATIDNAGAGTTEFLNTSSASSSKIINNGGTSGAEFGGTTEFHDTSNAGSATITNNGGTNDNAFAGFAHFFDHSTADSATITNNSSTAVNARPGTTEFQDSATAGSATITNSGATTNNGQGGFTHFVGGSTAGSATITSNGGTGPGLRGGFTEFGQPPGDPPISGTATAGSSIIEANGGTNGGLGGKTLFVGNADGGTARAITNGTGTSAGIFDISDLTSGSMKIGSIEGSGNYFLGSKTLTVGGNDLSTTVSGVIQDGGQGGGTKGSLSKEGSGTLTLVGANTYTGTTTVNSGSLIVDGSLASPQTVVNSGAFLGGHGTIGGSLVNNGMVGQNNSPGTLRVANNFTQNAGGTLRIGVAGTAPGQHDLLAVNGHAAVAGTMQVLTLGGFTFQPGDQITVVTARNGVSGTFNNAQNGLVNTGTIVQVKVTTLSDSVQLDATAGPISNAPGVGNTSTGRAVGKALDSAQGDPRAGALFAFLNSQPLADLPHDLELIAPTQITAINATAVSVANVQIANVIMRLADVHAGSTGFSSAGLSINSGTVSFESLAGPSGSEGKSGPSVFAPTPDNRWGVFVTGLGEFTDVYSTPGAPGYNVDTGGFTFGVDYRLTPNIAIGLTGGYAHTNVNPDAGGSINVNGGKLGGYATIFGNGLYLDTAVTGGPSGYQTRRTALQGTASGNTGGADFNVMVAAGYDWTKGNLSIGPTASFQYSYVGLNSFTETGSLAPLTFPNQNTQSELSAFGAKATYNWKIGKVIVLPQISAAWQHEYGATAYSVIASFANGAGNSFAVTGPNIGRDSLLVGAGATVILSDRVSTYLYYDGEFARTNYLSNNVSGGVRISF